MRGACWEPCANCRSCSVGAVSSASFSAGIVRSDMTLFIVGTRFNISACTAYPAGCAGLTVHAVLRNDKKGAHGIGASALPCMTRYGSADTPAFASMTGCPSSLVNAQRCAAGRISRTFSEGLLRHTPFDVTTKRVVVNHSGRHFLLASLIIDSNILEIWK